MEIPSSSFKREVRKLAMEDTLFIVLYWTGPVGLGAFFYGLGYLIKCIAFAARKDKEAK
jgi:hypothetical protein